MGGGKDFVEKVYFKIVSDTLKKQVLNGNRSLLVTNPESLSAIVTTKETGSKYLKEKPDTTVTYIVYRTPENPSVIGSSDIINLQTNIKEKDSFVSYIGTEVLPGGTQINPEYKFKATVLGASGRFKGAEKAKYIVHTTIEGNVITRTYDITISGHR